MPDRIDKHPYYKADPGSPHMNEDDYRHMGIPFDDGSLPSGEPNEALAAEIRTRLSQNPRINIERIQVDVRGNTAVLIGIVDDRYARERAEELAKGVDGVDSVANHLAIQPEDEAGGPTLTTRLPGADQEGSTQRS